MINKEIFRAYDIRGIYQTDLNEDVAYNIGRSLGTYSINNGKKEFLVGHDNRLSSPILSKKLIEGLLSTGINVVNINLVTTPMFYFARKHLNIWASCMITASHNPREYNGFKISFNNLGNAVGNEIEAFRDFTLASDFITGNGTLKEVNITDEYLKLISNSLHFGNKKIKVVIDCGNGTASTIIKKLCDMLPITYDLLYCESDGNFPNHHPDPSVSSNLIDLQKRVKELNYDIGFAVDADADRVRIVDNFGTIINSDIYMIIMYRYLNERLKNRTAVYDVKCSRALIDELDKLNISGEMLRTGNSYLYRKVNEDNIDFAGEYSGHMFFNDNFLGFDDGLYAGFRMVEILSKTDLTMLDLCNNINRYYSTDEEKIEVREDNKKEIIEEVKEYVINKKYKYCDIDGVRVEFEDGWALIRYSNTGPNITLRFEAKTEERLNIIKDEFINLISKIK